MNSKRRFQHCGPTFEVSSSPPHLVTHVGRLIHWPDPEFIEKYPHYVSENNAMPFLSSDKGKSYNLCHCKRSIQIRFVLKLTHIPVWSNFEIADMNFWRGEAYTSFLNTWIRKGGSTTRFVHLHTFSLELTMYPDTLAVGRRPCA